MAAAARAADCSGSGRCGTLSRLGEAVTAVSIARAVAQKVQAVAPDSCRIHAIVGFNVGLISRVLKDWPTFALCPNGPRRIPNAASSVGSNGRPIIA